MKRVINADNAKFDIAEVNFAVAFGKKFVREDSNEVKRFLGSTCGSIPTSTSIE